MKSSVIIVRLSLAAALLSSLSLLSQAQEVKLNKRQVPAAVLAAFNSTYPHATIRGYNREKENGNVYYEVESVEGETTRDVLYHRDGTVAEIEESMSLNDLPAGAEAALRARYPSAKISSAERITRGSVIEYEAHAKIGKRTVSMEFNAEGKPLKN